MIINRPRRNRKNENMRSLIRETIVTPKDLIAPLFVIDGKNIADPIKSMPGQFRFSIDRLVNEAKELQSLGIPCVSIFPVIDDKLKELEQKEKEASNLAKINYLLAEAHSNENINDESLKYLIKAREIYSSLDSTSMVMEIKLDMADLYSLQKFSFNKALDYTKEYLNYSKDSKNNKNIIKGYKKLGSLLIEK